MFNKKIRKHQNIGLITEFDKQSIIAEKFRTVRTNIQFSSPNDQKVLMITSANMSEGKSVVAANLAIVYAQLGKKTILVDSDLRRPTVHKTFQVSNRMGLSSLLSNNDNGEVMIQDTFIKTLNLLTSGPVPPNPADLIDSNRMSELIKLLSEKYDVVIFDAPPLLPVTDAVILSEKVDGVIMVTPQSIAKKDSVLRAVNLLKNANAKILGAIINQVDTRKTSVNYGYDYAYSEKREK